jgi:HEAT repeat protein
VSLGTLVLATVGLLPSFGLWRTAAAEPEAAVELTPRERLLQAMPRDPSVLINVSAADLPASSDVLDLGKRSTEALERCLADNVDPAARAYCAALLGAIGDRRALPALHVALEDWEANVRVEVLSAIARLGDPSSYGAVVKVWRRKEESESLRHQALGVLGALGHKDAVQLLRAELRKKPGEGDEDYRVVAFLALWRSRHLMARETLISDVNATLATGHTGLLLAATDAAAELRAPALVRALVPLLTHKDEEIRNRAVYALGLIGDAQATRALLDTLPKVREARMLNNIAFALERLDKPAFQKAIVGLARHKQAIIRLNAAYVLGDVKLPEGQPLLEESLGDPSDFVRTSALAALGKLGRTEAEKALLRFSEDPIPGIREEAVHALFALAPERYKDKLHDTLFASPFARGAAGHGMRRRAALALGRAGDLRVREYVLACFEQHACRYSEVDDYFAKDRDERTGGRLLRAWSLGRTELTDLLGQLRPAGTLPVALATQDAAAASGFSELLGRSLDLVGDVGTDAERDRVAPHAGTRDVRRRLRALTSLARLGSPSSGAQLMTELERMPAEWLPTFARAVSRVKEPKVRDTLRPELEKRTRVADPDVALAAAAVLLAWDPEQGVFRMLDGLSAPGTRERELAESYLKRNREPQLTWVLRRALAREPRPFTADRLKRLLAERS